MARFADAKIAIAQDLEMKKKYNYLIDLLDSEYSVEGLIGSSVIKVQINPQVGLAFYQDGVYRGGLDIIDGELCLVAQILTDDPSSDYYTKIDTFSISAVDYRGILGYLTSYSASDPAFYIVSNWNSGASTLSSKINLAGTAIDASLVGTDKSINIHPLGSTFPFISIYQDGMIPTLQLKASADSNIALYSGAVGDIIDITADELMHFDSTGTVLECNRSTFEYLGNEIWHAGNDGAGSTLDADKLDTYEASAFIRKAEVLHSVMSKSSDQTFATGTSATKVSFDTEAGDCSVSSNGCLVPTGDFIAIVTAYALFDANTTGLRSVSIRNGATVISIAKTNAANTGASAIQCNASFTATTGDIIYTYAYQNSGGDLNMDLASRMYITLIPTD